MQAGFPELVLFDRSPIGMYRSTHDGTFHHVNPALARMLGYTVVELMQRNLNRDVWVDPEARSRLINANRERGFVDGAQALWRRADGREIIVQIWGHVIEGPEPSFDAWIIDITDRENQRESLQRSVATLDLVLRMVPALYWRVDQEMRLVEVGGATNEVIGLQEPGRYVGQTIPEHTATHPSTSDTAAMHRRALAGETVSYDSLYEGRMMTSRIGPLRDATGAIIGAIGASTDVTRVRQLERRMIDAQRAESLGVLAGGLAHDFNNLLVAVIGSADLALRELPAGASPRAAIENIRDAGLRAAELTNQLLAYAGRGGAGTTRVLPAPLVAELLRIVQPTMPEGIEVSVDVPADLELRGDPAQVRQVVLNLIGNARDALGEDGRITVTARELDHRGDADHDDVLTAPPGQYILLEVTDDGPGMDAETRRHVFEPFFTTKQAGHGLGLASVLGIVRAHGGGIRVRTSPGKGARFEVLWPSAGEAGAHARPPVGARTVLVVDDESLVRNVVAQMIRDLGYDAVTAADGQGALALVQTHSVDAVLVDLTMPGMTGKQLISALRQRQPTLPVVLCSGFDRDGQGPVQADAYLPKPFRIEALERTLAKLLPLRSV